MRIAIPFSPLIFQCIRLIRRKFLLADPSTDEEELSDCQLTISICDGEVSFVYKPGGSSVSEDHFKAIVKEASNREKTIKELITAAIQAGPQRV